MTLISAHRCGVGNDWHLENTREGLLAALDLGVDYVEFDVQLTTDGAMVLHHDPEVFTDGEVVPISHLTLRELKCAKPDIVGYEEALDILAGNVKAHVDLKFLSPDYTVACDTFEASAASMAQEIMGANNYIVTSENDESVRAVTEWAKNNGHDATVGLSVGKSTAGMSSWDAFVTRVGDRAPFLRYRDSGANLVVSEHRLARNGFHRRIDLPLLVWTVDDVKNMDLWMGEAWVLTTNYPARALHRRDAWRNAAH